MRIDMHVRIGLQNLGIDKPVPVHPTPVATTRHAPSEWLTRRDECSPATSRTIARRTFLTVREFPSVEGHLSRTAF